MFVLMFSTMIVLLAALFVRRTRTEIRDLRRRIEHLERASAGNHEIVRDDLEPIHLGTSLKDVAVVLTP